MDTKELLYYYNKFKFGDECYHNLMLDRIENILLVSSFYDAYIFEQDGQLSQQIFGEYRELNLSSVPKITSVPTGAEALKKLEEEKFDMVLTMMHTGKVTPFILAEKIKEQNPKLPVVLLLSMLSDTKYIKNHEDTRYFDDIFLWNGDSILFLAIIKSIEDKINLEADTRNGLVRVVLIVEDSIKYYSMFLPLLYQEILKQTQYLIESDVAESNKRLRMRARPKLILVHNLEDANRIFDQYQEYIIGVISDTSYPSKGEIDNHAGVKLISKVKASTFDIPTVLLSSDRSNKTNADSINSLFLYKYSSHLLKRLQNFILNHMGFGEFIFRNPDGSEIARAKTLGEFKERLYHVPNQSILYHSESNHFSSWLMARGEIEIARKLKPLTYRDFGSIDELRGYLISTILDIQKLHGRGKIINFYDYINLAPNEVTRLSSGSLGGKGRGLAFLNSLLVAMDFDEKFPEVSIFLPNTAIIGTNEFDKFVEINNIVEEDLYTKTDQEIDQLFLKCQITDNLRHQLNIILDNARYPLAVRSSGLLEDSYAEPFAGIYRTFMLPNNHPTKEVRFKQMTDAIKLVYASVFSSKTREYIENMAHQLDEEKMAVIIQQIVGSHFDEKYFYPHFSGVAQSYNFYPIADMKNSDGIVSLAVGMGKAVVEGGRIYRFCPKYPKKDFLPPQAQLANSQHYFFALNMEKNNVSLIEGEDCTLEYLSIYEAKKHGSLQYIASTWDYQNNRIVPGVKTEGSIVVNFDNIIKYEYIPFAKIMDSILDIAQTALGMPAEIEFAVDLKKNNEYNKPTFYILQVRPLAIKSEDVKIPKNIANQHLFLSSNHAMGNGILDYLDEIIFIKPESFDRTKTEIMRDEIRNLNIKMKERNKQYILIGPGRWGSQDRFLGIPVKFVDISNAKVIVEAGFRDFDIDPSQGTHFFHNVVAMELGYFSIPANREKCYLDDNWLNKLEVLEETTYFRHVKTTDPMVVQMDGKHGVAIITKYKIS
ncbi:MAG: hypothetical protein JXQ65_00805 [Candidatus Marinimicrobia bacterium]|nr:hypothetical protein [Candidatus Neomarinimicrobiota bacterium]